MEKLGHDVVITTMKDKKYGTRIAFCRRCFLSRKHIHNEELKCDKDKGPTAKNQRQYWSGLLDTDYLKLEEHGVVLAKLRRWLAKPVRK